MKLVTGFLLWLWSSVLLAQLSIEDSYVNASLPGQRNTAAFMTVINKDDKPHKLTVISADVCDEVVIHRRVLNDGMVGMTMSETLELAAKQKLSLANEGYHIMLIGLTRPLREGEDVSLVVAIEDGSQYTVVAPVRSILGMQHQ